MKKYYALLATIIALFVGSTSAKAVEFLWAPYFPYAYSFEDEGWLYYFTPSEALYSVVLTGPNKDQIAEVFQASTTNAPDSLNGRKFQITAGATSAVITFGNNTYTEVGSDEEGPYTDTGTYSYYKAGASAALIILELDGEDSLAAFDLTFSGAGSGTFKLKYVNASGGGNSFNATGSFNAVIE